MPSKRAIGIGAAVAGLGALIGGLLWWRRSQAAAYVDAIAPKASAQAREAEVGASKDQQARNQAASASVLQEGTGEAVVAEQSRYHKRMRDIVAASGMQCPTGKVPLWKFTDAKLREDLRSVGKWTAIYNHHKRGFFQRELPKASVGSLLGILKRAHEAIDKKKYVIECGYEGG